MTVVLLDKLDPDGPVLGQISLRNIIRGAFQACHLGYSLDHQAVGKGLMYDASVLWLKVTRATTSSSPANGRTTY